MAAKFRPCLSAEQITHIIDCLAPFQSNDEEQQKIHNTTLMALRVFALKINAGIKTPQYIEKQAESMESQLGFAPLTNLTPEQKRHAAYLKWRDNPVTCSATELEMAMTYGYGHGSLTKSEYIHFCKEYAYMSHGEAEAEWNSTHGSAANSENS